MATDSATSGWLETDSATGAKIVETVMVTGTMMVTVMVMVPVMVHQLNQNIRAQA